MHGPTTTIAQRHAQRRRRARTGIPRRAVALVARKLVAWYREAHPHSEVARPALVRIVTPDDPLDDLRRLKPAVIRCGLATLSDRPAWARPARDAQVVDP